MVSSLYIPGRERRVLTFLLHAQADVTVKEIAKMLTVSVRTIHRDLKSIEKLIVNYNLQLIKKSGVGLRIIGNKADKQQLELAISNVIAVDYTPEERQAIILSTLFETNEPIKLFALADELKVTVATISNDLDLLEVELAIFHLQLIRKRGYGVKLEGNEVDKRAAISNLIGKYVDPFEFVSLLKENIRQKSNYPLNTISSRLLGLVNPERLNTIEKKVEQTRKELTYELADSAHIGLVVHLALAIERLQKGDKIIFDPAYLKQINGTNEYAIASKLIENLEDSLHMDIPDDEIGYITMHLLGAKQRIDQHFLLEDSNLDVAYKAKELIQYINENLGVDLSGNTALLNDLVAHLKPAIYRLNQGMNISNPLIKEIRHDYEDLFLLVQKGVRETFPDMVFPGDEVGYLVLHFASTLLHGEIELDLKALVICSSGIGTAKMLATKLKQQVPEIKQVENKSMFDLEQSNLDDYDVVVSTIPLKGFDGAYILASPMLTEAEVHRIKKTIRQRKLNYKPNKNPTSQTKHEKGENFTRQLEIIQNYTNVMSDLLNAFSVTQMAAYDSMEDNLRCICNQLEKDQWILNKENVLNKLLEREKISGLGIPNTSLALYHTRSNDIDKPSFTINRINKPLTVKGMDGEDIEAGTLLVMLAPQESNQESLEVLSYLSSLIIQEQANMTLFESATEAQIKQFISEQFQSFLSEKKLL